MTFKEYMIKFNGVYVDTDGYYGAQCMDLMHSYIYNVLGLTNLKILAAPTAKDVYLGTPFGLEYFDKIPNTPTGIPKEGDIVFFGTGTGPAGHVCIFIEGDANKFKSFDVNWPVGSPAHVQDHTYGYCLGWLRFKAQPDIQGQLNQCVIDRNGHWDFLIAIADILKKPVNKDVILPELKRLVQLEDVVREKDKQIQEAQTKIAELESKVGELTKNNETMAVAQATLTAKGTEQQKMIDDQGREISTLTEALATLKAQLVDGISAWGLIAQGMKKLFGEG